MRRVNITTGIKQRMNDILGKQDPSESDGILTSWSIQTAMLSNLNRIVAAMVGNALCGRVIAGLELTKTSDLNISISNGYGLTKNGGVISLHSPLSYAMNSTYATNGDGTYYLHMVHNIVECDEDSEGNLETSVVNESGLIQIVYDEESEARRTLVVADNIIEVAFVASPSIYHEGMIKTNDDLVYLGQFEISGGVIDSSTIRLSYDRGMYPNTAGSSLSKIAKLQILEFLNVDGTLNCSDIVSAGGAEFQEDVELAGNGTALILTNSTGGQVKVTCNAAANGVDYTTV